MIRYNEPGSPADGGIHKGEHIQTKRCDAEPKCGYVKLAKVIPFKRKEPRD